MNTASALYENSGATESRVGGSAERLRGSPQPEPEPSTRIPGDFVFPIVDALGVRPDPVKGLGVPSRVSKQDLRRASLPHDIAKGVVPQGSSRRSVSNCFSFTDSFSDTSTTVPLPRRIPRRARSSFVALSPFL